MPRFINYRITFDRFRFHSARLLRGGATPIQESINLCVQSTISMQIRFLFVENNAQRQIQGRL